MTETKTAAKRFAYYPGCSLKSSGGEYDHSTRAALKHIGVELTEIPDWVCCGASSAHNLSHELALALPLKTLILAEPVGLDVLAPCAACYNRLKVAETSVAQDPDVKKRMEEIVEKPFGGSIKTVNILDALEQIGLGETRARVVKPLAGLKAVCYYGCLLTRPPKKLTGSDPDNPTGMDNLLAVLGAEPKFWSYKTDCCGAGHAMARSDVVKTLVGKLRESAEEAGAEAIVTACPMCHANIDMRQETEPGNRMPVFFITELMGLAFGLPQAQSWLKKHLVDPLPLLKKLNLL
ncbi:MAG: succinate dehydrogenase/fumarate reductase iron-sulfur subunit [bacterium ADurb.Bin236]|nr:MAG: succinate dehydrogenase/fumarate reductase iron-sulfur subunit [bacterium ADurb.Bin236]HPN93035.1 CoB--CoM heterodisulfide reductase iron-sulfur subunit B family protein [bacterium]